MRADPHGIEPLLDVHRRDGKRQQRDDKCVLFYRVFVVILLLSILGLLVADVLHRYTTDEGSSSQCANQPVYSNPVVPSLKQKLPEACGHLSAIPPLSDDSYELKQVQVIIRHGDRVQWQPKKCWSSSTSVWNCSISMTSTPSFNRTTTTMDAFRLFRHKFEYGVEPILGDCYVGQLTLRGYEQQIQNGMNLRKAYINSGFLGSSFNSSDVYIRSDDEPRTLQSVEAVINGMYPPSTLKGKEVEVIDINTRDMNVEIMDSNPTLCPIVDKYEAALKNSSEVTARVQKVVMPLLRQLDSLLKRNLTSDDLDALADCMTVYTCHGQPLPAGVTTDIFQRVLHEVTWFITHLYSYPSVENGTKANIGFLIKSLFDRLEGKVEGKDHTKFIIYSGHDTTLLPLLVSFQLDINDIAWPPYASLMAIELYRSKQRGNYAVRVVYNGQTLQLPFCNGKGDSTSMLCEWEVFKEHLQNLIPDKEFCDGQ